ncbi:MAG: hypothetical protein DI551_02625 [Micavibrio aeruginosavorus]|uniref:Uncharacterized protein n=1 Tax=Micavibrio aeruginosavorus TaxID=349221 RepID=A0A2W5N3B5_9BACT|nr:MAG: hypothetical protein DI551_02625 [Micavibrio aeruginosavorus]
MEMRQPASVSAPPLTALFDKTRAVEQLTPAKSLSATPYTALQIQPQMQEPIIEKIKFLYEQEAGTIIPICRFGSQLEPPDVMLRPIVTAAVDDHNGLQIILMTIGGKDKGPDGIPYHAIWSYTPSEEGARLIADKDYKWPVKTLSKNMDIVTALRTAATTAEMRPYERVLTVTEKRAEELAFKALPHVQNHNSFFGADFDFLSLNIPLRILPLRDKPEYHSDPAAFDRDCIHPALYRVAPREDGSRHLNYVNW